MIPKSVKVFSLLVLIPINLYFFLPEYLFPITFLFSLVGGIYLSWIIFKKISKIGLYSNARLFGAFLLSIGMFVAGIIIGWSSWISNPMTVSGSYFPFFSLFNPLYDIYFTIYDNFGLNPYQTARIFLGTFGLGLMIVGGYLHFRFMRKAGIIIFPR